MISKSAFIKACQCLKWFYLYKKYPYLKDKLSEELKAKYERGQYVGILAWKLFPNGISLQPTSIRAYKKTPPITRFYLEQKASILYEVPFYTEDLYTILDIMTYKNDNWQLYEVKSSTEITEVFLNDIAFQKIVIEKFGVHTDEVFLIHLKTEFDYNLNIPVNELFVLKNVKDEVEARRQYVLDMIEKCRKVLADNKMPDISTGEHCFNPYQCEFIGYCWKIKP